MTRSIAVTRRAEAARAGLTDVDLRQMTVRGELARVRRGGYVSGDAFAELSRVERHATAVIAALGVQRERTLVSAESAAVLLGLPDWSLDLRRVHVAKSRRNAGRITSNLHVHSAPFDEDEVVELDGILVDNAIMQIALSIVVITLSA